MGSAGERAVVIGASMAGLLAARVLATHFAEVTIVDRDAFPPGGEPRKGVPQGRHSHVLLAKGEALVEQLFPRISDELVAAGAIATSSRHLRWWIGGDYLCTSTADLPFLLASRPLLEHHVRRRVLQLPNVRALEHCDVLGLTATDDRRRITGVRLHRRAFESSAVETLPADLVVDASGRGSRTPAWLEALDYEPPAEDLLRVGLGYTTRLYRRRPGELDGAAMVVTSTAPPDWRFGVLLAQENDRWTLSAGGYLGDHAPTTEDGFLEFVTSLPAREIHDVITRAEPLSDHVPYKFPASIRRRYEKLARFPDGYLVLGDAICSFNPVFAQGMTVSALEADALGRCLADGDHRLAHRFFRAASRIIDVAWTMAVGDDLRNPAVEGERPFMWRVVNWYMQQITQGAHHDGAIARAFLRVVGMQAAPRSLLSPCMAFRVLQRRVDASGRKAVPSQYGRPATD